MSKNDKEFRAYVRRDAGYGLSLSVRFTVAEGLGLLDLKSPNRKTPKPAAEYEEAEVDSDSLRGGRFVHIQPDGSRRSYAMSRLQAESLAKISADQWTELAPSTEFGFRYLDLPADFVADAGQQASAAITLKPGDKPVGATLKDLAKPGGASLLNKARAGVALPASTPATSSLPPGPVRHPSASKESSDTPEPPPTSSSPKPAPRPAPIPAPAARPTAPPVAAPAPRAAAPAPAAPAPAPAAPRPAPVATSSAPRPPAPGEAPRAPAARKAGPVERTVPVTADLADAAFESMDRDEAVSRLRAEIAKVERLQADIDRLKKAFEKSAQRETDLIELLGKWRDQDPSGV
jgi:hypothetical protein